MKNERTLLFLQNGDICLHDNFTYTEAKKTLKRKGYISAYSGRKFDKYGIKVLVGINAQNNVNITQRRKNGLFRAKEICI